VFCVCSDEARLIEARGEPLPAPIVAKAMIDTGASGTTITQAAAEKLRLRAMGTEKMYMPSSAEPVYAAKYCVDIIFPGDVRISNIAAVEASFDGRHIDCLIGRDVLKYGLLVYSGHLGQFTLSF
ncbi:MAG: retropepsin-like aspartic protease, partial [Gammaproteobacteria bacterium]